MTSYQPTKSYSKWIKNNQKHMQHIQLYTIMFLSDMPSGKLT